MSKKKVSKKRIIKTSGLITLNGDPKVITRAVRAMRHDVFPGPANMKKLGKDLNARTLATILAKDYLVYREIPLQVLVDMLEYVFFHYLLMFQLIRSRYENVDQALFNSKTLSRRTYLELHTKSGGLILPKEFCLDADFYADVSLSNFESGLPLLNKSPQMESFQKKHGDQCGDDLIFTSAGVFRFEYIFRKFGAVEGTEGATFNPAKVVVTPITNEKLLELATSAPSLPLSILFRIKCKTAGLDNDLKRHQNQVAEQFERVVGILTKINR